MVEHYVTLEKPAIYLCRTKNIWNKSLDWRKLDYIHRRMSTHICVIQAFGDWRPYNHVFMIHQLLAITRKHFSRFSMNYEVFPFEFIENIEEMFNWNYIQSDVWKKFKSPTTCVTSVKSIYNVKLNNTRLALVHE